MISEGERRFFLMIGQFQTIVSPWLFWMYHHYCSITIIITINIPHVWWLNHAKPQSTMFSSWDSEAPRPSPAWSASHRLGHSRSSVSIRFHSIIAISSINEKEAELTPCPFAYWPFVLRPSRSTKTPGTRRSEVLSLVDVHLVPEEAQHR